jgi:hypothetical protein
MEYVAVKVRVRNISTRDRAEAIDTFYFETTGSAGVLYDPPSVVDPSPVLDVTLFPGGEYEGWIALQAAEDESDLLVVFEPPFSLTSKDRRFLSLQP